MMFTCSSVAGQLICDSRRQFEMSARKKIIFEERKKNCDGDQ